MAYDMMAFMGVPTPLCSYAWVTVNGEDWGLFLAVEEPEEALRAGILARIMGSYTNRTIVPCNEENADVASPIYRTVTRTATTISSDNAKFDTSDADRERLIEALQSLSDRRKSWNRRSMWTRCCGILPYRFL